jgi:hypothetical protein
MSTKAITQLDYMVGKDGAVGFESPVMDLTHPFVAINFQLKWGVGVKGKFTWYATIFPDLWEPLVACEEVTYTVGGIRLHTIVSLPNTWLGAGFIKFVWVPDAGSVGDIDVALRIVPT